MAIKFSNDMSIVTDTDFKIIGTDGSTMKAQVANAGGMLEKANPVWRMVYCGVPNPAATNPVQNPGDQYVQNSGILPFRHDYGGEGDHFNFSTYKFICPVKGNYRMSHHVLMTGSAYTGAGGHHYPIKNDSQIQNGVHLVGNASLNYISVQAILTIQCAAGDTLCWHNGGTRAYTGGWSVCCYELLG